MVDSLDWDDDEVTRPAGVAFVPVVPFSPRIRIIGVSPAELDEEPAPTTRECAGDPFDEPETAERDTRPDEGGVDPNAVSVSPIVDVDGPLLPTWDDVTIPRHAGDLRERAKRLAELSRVAEPVIEAAPMVTIDGRDTVVDASPEATAPLGTTAIIEPPPTEQAATERDAVHGASASPEVIIDVEKIRPGDDLPVTLPRESSFPDSSLPARSFHPRSVEVDLAALDEREKEEAFPKPVTDWRPLEEHAVITEPPRARRAHELKPSVPPVTMSSPSPPRGRRRRGVAIAALGVMLILCSTIFGLWLLPKKGGVVVRLRTGDGHPAAKAEIFLDGQKRCDTDPCVIDGLSRGERTIKVIVPGSDEPRVASVRVRSGEHQTVWIDVPSNVQAEVEEPVAEPVEPNLTLHLKTPGARVVLVPDGQIGRVVSGPFPRDLDLPLGRYEVVASRHGYVPFVDRVELTDEAPTATVDVELAARASVSEEPTTSRQPAVDGAEPAPETDPAYWDPYADVEWD